MLATLVGDRPEVAAKSERNLGADDDAFVDRMQ
jgi:hypothetical protein